MFAAAQWVGLLALLGAAEEPSPQALEFFEKRVRPVLVEHCQKCHGEKEQKGGLRLDSAAAALRGGESGPALVPGHPEKSLLISAINYDPDGYQMPPTGKLHAEAIAALTEWVRLGAPWPANGAVTGVAEQSFNLRERAQHWSFQPVRATAPPDIVRREELQNPIDAFIGQRLRAAGLQPNPPADRRVLLRRVTYELTGLPPTLEELDAFLADNSPDAYERVVDRLLASPRYGERWGRHWLDLVRFAETGGHEFDYELRHAWPYRDYVIRAFNADVPYDQFVREHIAGDLLPEPRRDPATQSVESVIGTAFFWFGQGKHSPVDLRAEECDTMDNQLDVLGKTFLGLTIACARCHDHKFDPLTQRDYYALAGYLQSSRQTYADTAPPEVNSAVIEELHKLTRRTQPALWQQSLAALHLFVERLPELLHDDAANPASPLPPLPAEFVATWRKSLAAEALHDRGHPFHLWVHWAQTPDAVPQRVAQWQQARRAELAAERNANRSEPDGAPPGSAAASASELLDPANWFPDGLAFHRPATRELVPLWDGSSLLPLRGLVSRDTLAHSGTVSGRLQGFLRSPTFTINHRLIDYRAYRRGGPERPSRPLKDGQIHLIIDGFHYIKDPLYGRLSVQVARRDTPQWYRQDVGKFLGSRAYIEIEDLDDGEIVVEQIVLHDGERPADPLHPLMARALESAAIHSLADVARVYQQVCADALEALRREQLYGVRPFKDEAAAGASLVQWLCRQPLWPDHPLSASPAASEFIRRRQELEHQLLPPQYTLAMTDGSPENDRLLIRGNPRKPAEEVERRFLEVARWWTPPSKPACAEESSPASQSAAEFAERAPPNGSGRLPLADAVVDPANPLTARVLVNRLWQHHLGRGLVPTPDDFGKMGQPPTHPELLDWLAAELWRSGGSLKHIHRLIVTSHTYRQSSRAADPRAEEVDPENKLWHRANVQRLEAEAIRDALLALSGRLDDRMYGPGVLPHLTPFMEGRGRPGQSGPLDGAGRRSVYINVRRNFLTPMFLAFDFPTPFTTMGRRSVSNVPAQALALMNNPLVVEQAARWADQVLATTPEPAQRAERLYQMAYSRPPTAEELAAAVAFVENSSGPRAWHDLAHVLWNVKEFIFVE